MSLINFTFYPPQFIRSSHYPPPHTANLDRVPPQIASRLCGPIFATSDLEAQIVRLEGSQEWDTKYLEIPRFAPFVGRGFFIAHSDFLREVPFDPFLPWNSMGEEIIMSARLYTNGYDIFSPSESVVGLMYSRKHTSKYSESFSRRFTPGVYNPLQMMVLDRIKYQLGYPESAKDMIFIKSLLTAVGQYSLGKERSIHEYLEIIGLNMTTKEVTPTHWCESGKPPPGFEVFKHLYE